MIKSGGKVLMQVYALGICTAPFHTNNTMRGGNNDSLFSSAPVQHKEDVCLSYLVWDGFFMSLSKSKSEMNFGVDLIVFIVA